MSINLNTPAPANPAAKSKLKLSPKLTVLLLNSGLAIAAFVLSFAASQWFGWALFNNSFWTGFLAAFTVGLIVLAIWLNTNEALIVSRWIRGGIFVVTLLFALGALALQSSWFAKFDWPAFGQGLLVVVFLAAIWFLFWFRTWLRKKLNW